MKSLLTKPSNVLPFYTSSQNSIAVGFQSTLTNIIWFVMKVGNIYIYFFNFVPSKIYLNFKPHMFALIYLPMAD